MASFTEGSHPADGERIGAASAVRPPRRAVSFDGFGLLEDGTIFRLRVVELSYDGCKIETALGVFPGLRFKFSMSGFGGAIDAEVRWCKNGHAGVAFTRDQGESKAETPRREQRVALSAPVSLRRQGRHAFEGRLFDLTPAGCKVEFIERPRPDELLWVKLDCFDAIEARVKWVDGYYGGMEFVRPLHPAIFDTLVRRLKA